MKKVFILWVCLLSTRFCFSACVDTLDVHSSVMNKEVKNVVILPDNYYAKKKCSFPVLYLLHGAGGCYVDWIRKVPELQNYSDMYNVIVVCPDGGGSSWYLDSPLDSSYCYETYISKELVTYVDQHYRTVKNQKGRAITGNSMGGHGAFYLAFKHQDIWGATGSISGLFDLRSFCGEYDLSKRLGFIPQDSANWRKNSVIHMLHLLKDSKLSIVFECGHSDDFYLSNKKLHLALLKLKIPHDYNIREGNHDWEYWRNAIAHQFQYFYNFFSS